MRRRTPKRSSALGPRSSTHSLMALYPRMPHSVAALASASTVASAWRRPWRRRGSSMPWKNAGRERIWAALSIIFGAPWRRCGSRCTARSRVRAARQRVDEHPLRARVFAVAVAPALAAKAAGPSDLGPVRGSVDGAVETRRVDEGLDEQQRMAEAHRPITHETARAQRQHSRAEVARSAGQEQEPGVVGEQMQPVKLHRVVPANPAVARRALQRRCREHHQRQPLAAMMSDIAHRLADSGQRTEVVVCVHQLPKPSLLVRRDNVDPNFRESHHHVHAPTRASRHSYPSTGRKSSIAANSLSDRTKAQSTDPPCHLSGATRHSVRNAARWHRTMSGTGTAATPTPRRSRPDAGREATSSLRSPRQSPPLRIRQTRVSTECIRQPHSGHCRRWCHRSIAAATHSSQENASHRPVKVGGVHVSWILLMSMPIEHVRDRMR